MEYHGMIWIFDKLIEPNTLTKKAATQKLKLLLN